MNLFDMVFTYKNKVRGVIKDYSKARPKISQDKTLIAARTFSRELGSEMKFIKKVNQLLSDPIIEMNKDKHLTLTMPVDWLDNNKALRIVFSLDTSEPLSAYFVEESQ